MIAESTEKKIIIKKFHFHPYRFSVQTQCKFRRESCSCRDWDFGHMQCNWFSRKLSLPTAKIDLNSPPKQNGSAYDDVIRWADAFLIIYSIIDRDSFHEAEKWLKKIAKLKLPSYFTTLLLGNKNDLEHSRWETKMHKLRDFRRCWRDLVSKLKWNFFFGFIGSRGFFESKFNGF